MSAQLKPIEARCIERPVYRRTDLLSYAQEWIAANHDLLAQWFGNGDINDWDIFCLDQHAREADRRDQYKDDFVGHDDYITREDE